MTQEIYEVQQFIENMITPTYRIITDDSYQILLELKPKQLGQADILRIKRYKSESANLKTVLCAHVIDEEQSTYAMRWAAYVQEELVNNESADLYLLLFPIETDSFSLETCINIEANDQFCRKYVRRPNETLTEMLDRTFLCGRQEDQAFTSLSDPLRNALLKTAREFPFLNVSEQEVWRNAMLSGMSGLELASALLNYTLPKD